MRGGRRGKALCFMDFTTCWAASPNAAAAEQQIGKSNDNHRDHSEPRRARPMAALKRSFSAPPRCPFERIDADGAQKMQHFAMT